MYSFHTTNWVIFIVLFSGLIKNHMLKNYLKTALRSMGRQKVHTFINIVGLATGMAACLLIILWVRDELSFDRYHKQSDRIYRVSREWFNENGETSLNLGMVAPPFGPLLEGDFEGEIEEAVRFVQDNNPLLTIGEKKLVEEQLFFADSDIGKVFSWKMVEGDWETALTEPNSLVLTESTAKKYFGDQPALGQTINYSNIADVKVTGIVEDVPVNSHFSFNALCSFITLENFYGREELMKDFGGNNFPTYLLLEEGVNAGELESRFPAFLDKHLGLWNGFPSSKYNALNLMPLTQIHLHSHLDSEIEQNGDITYVYLFSAVAFLILLIACINFINLSTARSSTRAKEIGLRKVIGAFRGNLIRQFITESVLLAVFALVLAVSMVELLLPWFNNFFGKDLHIDFLNDPWTLPGLLGLALVAGLAAGSYPALYLSSFEPVAILKGKLFSGGKGSFLRSTLVVVQFSISVALIAGVMMLQDQLRFMKNKPLGFNRENLVMLPSNDDIYNRFESLKSQWLSQPGITDVTLASRVPSGRLLDSQGATAEINGEMKTVDFRIADVHVSHDYLSTLEVKMAAGRDFDSRLASDSLQSFILNESAVKAIGWESAETAIGKKMDYGDRTGVVVGVTEDFHFENLRQSIAPVIFMITDGRAGNVVFRIQEGTRAQAIDYLEKQWAFLREGFPFTYQYVDESFNSQYETEDRLGKVIGYFSLLAIVIAALGLFGLALFTTSQRSKEIGIRKVLGASAGQIIVMLTGKFSQLVVAGIVVGGTIAYVLGKTVWLKNFAYQGEIRWGTFVLAGLAALLIAWVTVAWQSYQAATANPVDAIRQD